MAIQLTTEYQLLGQVLVGNTGYSNVYLRDYAKYNSQDLTNNKTNVSVQSRIYVEVGGFYQQSGGWYYIGLTDNGVIEGQANQQFNQGETVLGTSTGWVNHNSDGTKTNCECNVAINFIQWGWNNNVNVNDVILPTIPRQSELIEKPVFTMSTDGNTQTFKVNIKKNNPNFYDILRITSSDGQIVIKQVNGVTEGEHTYTFTEEERNRVFQAYGTNTIERLQGRVETWTSQGGTNLGYGVNGIRSANAITLNYTISTTASITDTINTYNTYKPNNHTFIANLSKPQFDFTTTSSTNSFYGRTPSYKLNNNVISDPYTENNFTGQSFTFNATDGRMNTTYTPSSSEFTSIPYFKPSLTTIVKRTSPTGSTASVNVSGNLYDGTGLTNLLTPSLKFKYTESGGSEQEITIPLTINGNNFTGSATISGLNYQKSLTWTSILTDRIGVTTNNGNTLPQGLPVYHAYRKNDENYFNVIGKLLIKGVEINTYKLDTEIIIGYDADSNKPIYRYGHYISSLPNNATVTYDIGLTNVDKVFHCYGTCEDGYELNAVRPKGITSSIGVWYTNTNNRVNIETGVDRSNRSATVWVVYTKTTD